MHYIQNVNMCTYTHIHIPKAACRRVAVTPPPPASRRSGGGGVTAYMPRKVACWQWSAKESKEAGGREAEERNEAEEREV